MAQRSLFMALDHRSVQFRLVAAMVLVSLPLLVVLAVLLTGAASSGLTQAGEREGVSRAEAEAQRVSDWLAERRDDCLRSLSGITDVGAATTGAQLGALDRTLREFCVDRGHRLQRYGAVVVAAGGVDGGVRVRTGWPLLRRGRPVVTSPVLRGDRIQWVVAQPVSGGRRRPVAVVVGDLSPAVLTSLLDGVGEW